MTQFSIARTYEAPVALPARKSFQHNLPMDGADFYIVRFYKKITSSPFEKMVLNEQLSFIESSLETGVPYKVLALKIKGGIEEGVWWVDEFIMQDGVLNIEFKSQGEDSGSGEEKTFAGTLTQDGQPVSRSVYALAIDGDKPKLLSHVASDAAGNYLLKWNGYIGQIMVMATDEYGSLFTTNETLSVGARLHPAQPNGYVYEVTQAGITDAEPSWTAQEGAVVLSGGVQLTAKPYYRGKTAGPFTIT